MSSSRALAIALCVASATAEPSACLAGHLLPTVLLVGGQKCGSTSLHADLTRSLEHLMHVSPGKGISGTGNKEVAHCNHDARYAKGRAWYTSLFPEPQLRLILIVCNPVDRLRSYHGHFKTSEPVDNFVTTMLTNTSRCARKQGIDPRSSGLFGALCVPESVALVSFHGYLDRVLSDLGEFIGLTLITHRNRLRMLAKLKHGWTRRKLTAWPRGAVRLNARENTPMSQSSREVLEAFYAPHNARLIRMLKLPKYVTLVSSPIAPASVFTLDSLLSK
ncbi:P-loop containing nucleoside triphosphate hydrolase protein [Pavlovales sp. CCMP2436]|nr:P-loop containing nucleoside triphosphate hydrolase protein [Pavlovales sp. CCMP2436]